MWAVGHLALGYLLGKGVAKTLHERNNIPLLFLTAIAPDVDILIPTLPHRGPTHSLVIYPIVFIPLYIMFGKKVVIYFASVASHILVGDLLFTGGAGGMRILWPLTAKPYSGLALSIQSYVLLEWLLFFSSIGLMVYTKDLYTLFKPHPTNLVLLIPVLTIILPVFLGFPPGVPSSLFIPHLVYLGIIAFSILMDLKAFYTRSS